MFINNQKPFSVNETKNFKGSKKSGLQFVNGVCATCQYLWPKIMEK